MILHAIGLVGDDGDLAHPLLLVLRTAVLKLQVKPVALELGSEGQSHPHRGRCHREGDCTCGDCGSAHDAVCKHHHCLALQMVETRHCCRCRGVGDEHRGVAVAEFVDWTLETVTGGVLVQCLHVAHVLPIDRALHHHPHLIGVEFAAVDDRD